MTRRNKLTSSSKIYVNKKPRASTEKHRLTLRPKRPRWLERLRSISPRSWRTRRREREMTVRMTVVKTVASKHQLRMRVARDSDQRVSCYWDSGASRDTNVWHVKLMIFIIGNFRASDGDLSNLKKFKFGILKFGIWDTAKSEWFKRRINFQK